jgi:acyl carrier protein
VEYLEQDLVTIVVEIISDETGYPESKIELHKSLADELDIDSISIMTIFVNIQNETGIDIPDGDWSSLTTVELIVEYLLNKQKGE